MIGFDNGWRLKKKLNGTRSSQIRVLDTTRWDGGKRAGLIDERDLTGESSQILVWTNKMTLNWRLMAGAPLSVVGNGNTPDRR